MDSLSLLEEALEERGNAVMMVARATQGETAIIRYANATMARIIAQPAGSLDGACLTRLAAVADPADWSALITALRGLVPLHLDMRLHVDGRPIWLGFGLTFKPDAATGEWDAILVGRDITQAKSHAKHEDETRRLLAGVFLRISAPVAIVRQGGEIIMSNPAFQHLLGYTAEQVLKLNVGDLTPEMYAEAARAARARQLRDGGSYEMRLETLTRDGSRVPVRLTSMLLPDTDQRMRVVTLIPDTEAPAPPPQPLGDTTRDGPGGEAGRVLYDLLAARPRVEGQVRTISLAALRDSFGSDWERISLRAQAKAEQVIKRRLGVGDVFSRGSDHDFVIWFENQDMARNTATLGALVREIRLCFVTEFGRELAAHIGPIMLDLHAEPPDPRELAEARLAQERQHRGQAAAELVQTLRRMPRADLRPVTDRSGIGRALLLVDFAQPERERLRDLATALPQHPPSDGDIDLLRLELAARHLAGADQHARANGPRVLVPVSWAALATPGRRREMEARLKLLSHEARQALTLAVFDAPDTAGARRWSEIVLSLRRQIGDVALQLSLSARQSATPQEAAVADWSLSLLVIDATAPDAPPPDAHFRLIAAARHRDIEVLVRVAHAADTHDWRELGATLFA